jgi:two-component system osmolarity sensor histidine kinase EnvZ
MVRGALRAFTERAHLIDAAAVLSAAALTVAARRAQKSSARKRDELQAQLRRMDHERREREHDARSIVTGALGAVALLSRPDPIDRIRVRGLLAAELDRLRTTLDSEAHEQVGEFPVAEALEPVVFAHCLTGAKLGTDLADVRVLGRRRATATAVANLLDNARVHAPDANVTLRIRRVGADVEITVEDDGPGIAADQREHLLERGARGDTDTPGRGLGLFTAARAITDQDGSIRLFDTPGGGMRVVLTLPAAQPSIDLPRAS